MSFVHSSDNQLHIKVPRRRIVEFCRKWKIVEFSFFGSVLRDDFRPESDIDVLVKFVPNFPWGLFDLVKMQDELSNMLKRPVDLVNKKAVNNSTNWIRKESILDSAMVYYER